MIARFLFTFASIILLVGAAKAQKPVASITPAPTGIEGIILIGPIRGGPAKEGVSNTAPLADTELKVETDKGRLTTFRTDGQGQFRLVLPPGHYRFALMERRKGIGRFGPFEADIAAGEMKKVEWRCDTGMR